MTAVLTASPKAIRGKGDNMIDYDVTKIQKLFDEHGINELEVIRVVQYKDCTRITIVQKMFLNEYVKSHYFKKLIFKSSGKTYELSRFYVNVGGEKGRVKVVYALKKGDLIIDVMAYHEFENAENFANPNLTLIIDKIIAEDY